DGRARTGVPPGERGRPSPARRPRPAPGQARARFAASPFAARVAVASGSSAGAAGRPGVRVLRGLRSRHRELRAVRVHRSPGLDVVRHFGQRGDHRPHGAAPPGPEPAFSGDGPAAGRRGGAARRRAAGTTGAGRHARGRGRAAPDPAAAAGAAGDPVRPVVRHRPARLGGQRLCPRRAGDRGRRDAAALLPHARLLRPPRGARALPPAARAQPDDPARRGRPGAGHRRPAAGSGLDGLPRGGHHRGAGLRHRAVPAGAGRHGGPAV
ncbi:MAG: hypothetical protein AVDCRST_MAG69-1051, partial [uncultured Solirubrobacteraceae bacterium]